jgi:hypothetical protein
MMQHVRCVNSNAKVVRAVAGRVVNQLDINLLLPPSNYAVPGVDYHASPMQEARRCFQQGWEHSSLATSCVGVGLGGPGKLQTMICDGIPAALSVSRPRLLASLQTLLGSHLTSLDRYSSAASACAGPTLYHLTAILMVSSSDSEQDRDAATACRIKAVRGSICITPLSRSLPQPPSHGRGLPAMPSGSGSPWRGGDEGVAPPQAVVVATGFNLDPSRIMEALLHEEAPALCSASVMTEKDVNTSQRRSIRQKHLYDTLPEGFFFDGVNYVDFDGNMFPEHPHMAQFIQEYLGEQNRGEFKSCESPRCSFVGPDSLRGGRAFGGC